MQALQLLACLQTIAGHWSQGSSPQVAEGRSLMEAQLAIGSRAIGRLLAQESLPQDQHRRPLWPRSLRSFLELSVRVRRQNSPALPPGRPHLQPPTPLFYARQHDPIDGRIPISATRSLQDRSKYLTESYRVLINCDKITRSEPSFDAIEHVPACSDGAPEPPRPPTLPVTMTDLPVVCRETRMRRLSARRIGRAWG